MTAVIWLAVATVLEAAPSHEALLPNTTRAYVGAQDIGKTLAAWQRTEASRVFADPQIAAFLAMLDRDPKSLASRAEALTGLR